MLQFASLFAVEIQTVLVSRHLIVSSEMSGPGAAVAVPCGHSVTESSIHARARLQTKFRLICVFKIVTMPVVLYGCQAWFVTLREERSLSVFENRVLSGIFGPKRDEETGE